MQIMHSAEIAEAGAHVGEIRLQLLGQAKALTATGEEVPLPRKAFALAAYLLLESPKGRMHRSDAAALLWDDMDVERRAGNFRQLLSRLRFLQSNHESRLFVIGSDYIALDTTAASIDVQIFREAIADQAASQIVTICDAYGGDLLGDSQDGGQKFAQWLRARRASLNVEFTSALTAHLENAANADYPELTVLAAERLIKLDPTQEAGYRALMRVHGASGQMDIVRQIYARLERILRKENNARPASVTRELFEALTAGEAQTASEAKTTDTVEEPAVPSIGRFLPRMIVLPPAPGIVSPGQQTISELVDDLTLNLWRTRSFVLLTPRGLTSDLRSHLAASAARDIDYILEVRMQRSIAHAMSVRLVSVASGEILWAGAFEAQENDHTPVALIVQTVVEQVESNELKLADQATARVVARRQAIQGQRLLQVLDLPSIRRARNVMRSALATADDCIPALTGMARSFVLEGMLAATADGRLLDEAEILARKAIGLDPEDFRGYQELGVAHLYQRKFDSGIEMLRSARRHNPIDVSVQVDLADALLAVGKPDESLEVLNAVRHLIPFGLDIGHWIAASAHYCREDYRATAQEIELMQNPAPAYRVSAAAYAMLGEKEIAGRLKSAAMEFNPNFKVKQWLAVCPIGSKELIQHYEDGLLIAGFA